MTTKINCISKGKGTALVFQHGLTANIKQAEALFSGLKKIHLLSIDCPGHGLSPLPDDYSLSFDQYADEVIHLMNRMDVQKAIFGGISMGSGISINIALRYPDRVRGLFLVRPAWLDWPDPENLSVLLPAADLMNVADGKDRFINLDQFKAISPPPAAQSILGIFNKEQQPELSRVIRAMVGDQPFQDLQDLKQITVPTMVIGNDDDPLHPYPMAEKIHESITDSVLRKVTSRYIDDQFHSAQIRKSLEEFISKNNLQ